LKQEIIIKPILKKEFLLTIKTSVNLMRKSTIQIMLLLMMLPLLGCTKGRPVLVYQSIPPGLERQLENPAPNEPKGYKGAINCGLPTAKCISNIDLDFEDRQRKALKEGLALMIGIIKDQNDQYMNYLGKPCPWLDFECKKERKRTKKP